MSWHLDKQLNDAHSPPPSPSSSSSSHIYIHKKNATHIDCQFISTQIGISSSFENGKKTKNKKKYWGLYGRTYSLT